MLIGHLEWLLQTAMRRELGQMDIVCREEAELPKCLSRGITFTSAKRRWEGVTDKCHPRSSSHPRNHQTNWRGCYWLPWGGRVAYWLSRGITLTSALRRWEGVTDKCNSRYLSHSCTHQRTLKGCYRLPWGCRVAYVSQKRHHTYVGQMLWRLDWQMSPPFLKPSLFSPEAKLGQ